MKDLENGRVFALCISASLAHRHIQFLTTLTPHASARESIPPVVKHPGKPLPLHNWSRGGDVP